MNNTKANKEWFWEVVGSYCRKCGYDKSIYALHCHHLDKTQKNGVTDTLASTMQRSRKYLLNWIKRTRFIIICANCHAELHRGLWKPENYQEDNKLFAKFLSGEYNASVRFLSAVKPNYTNQDLSELYRYLQLVKFRILGGDNEM